MKEEKSKSKFFQSFTKSSACIERRLKSEKTTATTR